MAPSKPLRVLAGSVVRQEMQVFEAYIKSLKALKTPPRVELDFAFVHDDDNEKLYPVDRTTVLRADPRPKEADYAVGADTHHWNVATFEHLAKQKQRLLDYTLKEGYDYFFLVDSDLLLEPTTLINLLHSSAPVVSAVFWTAWQNGGEFLPQVWLRHPYDFAGLGQKPHEFMAALMQRKLIRVTGGGACTLIHRSVIEAGVGYHPRVPGLPQEGMWQGEDRTFAINLQNRLHRPAHGGGRQYACAFSDIYHAYHPQQRTPEALAAAWEKLSAPRQLCAKFGDYVHFTIDPLEEPNFAAAADPTSKSHRGRLGGIKVLPEIETTLLDMSVSDERMLELRFPPWYPITNYANTTKIVLLKLVDVKPA